MGNMNDVKRLRGTSIGYLRAVLEETGDELNMGLDLSAFVRHCEEYYCAFGSRTGARNHHDSSAYPYLRLSVEERRQLIS